MMTILPAAALLLLAGGALAQPPAEPPAGHAGMNMGKMPMAGPEAASHPMAARHGGTLAEAGDYRFETTLTGGELRVYVYGADGNPMEVGKLAGTAAIDLPDGQARKVTLAPAAPQPGEAAVYYCPMHPQAISTEPGKCQACGGMKLMTQGFLQGELKLPKAPATPAKVAVTVQGIGGKDGKISFEQTVPATTPTAAPAAEQPKKS